MTRKIFILFLVLAAIEGFAQRTVVNLNRDWKFTPGWEVAVGVGEMVNVPHTWNLDALSARKDYHRGLGNYIKTISVPSTWKDKRVYLRFKGAAQTANIYINSKHVGTHKGSYTAFGYDITGNLNFGTTNTIWVRLTNADDLDVMPLVGDFNMYGGLYRDVELIVTPLVHLSHGQYATSGVTITTTNVSTESASINVTTDIEGPAGRFTDVHFKIKDASGAIVDSTSRRVQIDMSSHTSVAAMFTIAEPHLWNGVEDPYLYRAEVTAYSIDNPTAKKPLIQRDSIAENFGLRFFEVDGANQFKLNGRPYRLQGVGRHQDWAMLGSAIYRENHDRDIELMREMGVNAVRLTHYPQDPYFIDLCDKAGIIVWSEIPFIGPGGYAGKGFNDSENFKENGRQQLLEMIHQLYNHPSIMFWGLFNELVQRGDDPLQYVRSLNDLTKNEDPSRLTVAASNQDGELNMVTDLIGFNQYMGWYGGMPRDIEVWGASVRKDFPRLHVGLSEYGAGASIYQHQDSLVKPVANSYWHPEEWQTYFHEQYWRVIASKNYFWGTFLWVMFDFGAAHRTEGTRPGINDKGLVTFDRLVRKDAFYFYKANWNKNDKFVYITSRRYTERTGLVQNFKVFSSCADVQLIVNDTPLGIMQNDGYGTFTWPKCQMQQGVNVIEALSSEGHYDRIEITII